MTEALMKEILDVLEAVRRDSVLIPGGKTLDEFAVSGKVMARVHVAVEKLEAALSTHSAEGLKEYDPNIRWAKQTVEVMLMCWGYSAKITTAVSGNCKGADIFDTAIGMIYDSLPETRHGAPYVILTKPNGDTLEDADDEGRGEEWLKDLVVSMTITKVEPEALLSTQDKESV